jgi:hypothetical protein
MLPCGFKRYFDAVDSRVAHADTCRIEPSPEKSATTTQIEKPRPVADFAAQYDFRGRIVIEKAHSADWSAAALPRASIEQRVVDVAMKPARDRL